MQYRASSENHHQAHLMDMKRRFFICTALSIPVFLLIFIPFWGSEYLVFLLATIIYLYGGAPFLRGMYTELRHKAPGMMTLVSIAITVSYLYSTAIVLGLPGMTFFLELVTLIDVMLLGHWIEMRSVQGASSALEALTRLLPAKAHVLQDAGIEDISVDEVTKGMHVLIKPGEKVPADGTVLKGESEVNEAALTGESLPVLKKPGESVIAGSLNGNGSLTIEVTKDQKENYIAQIKELVGQVLESKSRAQDLADKAAVLLTFIALFVGFGAFGVWVLRAPLVVAFERLVAVMVTACPHALGLAIPLVIMVITVLAAKNGLLITNRRAFEQAASLDMVVFDKTGTLTKGAFQVTDIMSTGAMNEDDILALATSTCPFGQHSITHAITDIAHERALAVPEATEGITLPGKGVQVRVEGKQVLFGNRALLEEHSIQILDSDPLQQAEQLMAQGKTASFLAVDGQIEGIIAVADTIREESFAACNALKEQGIGIAMITGDTMLSARGVAEKLGIERVMAQVLPADKAAEIEKMKAQGLRVAMVGDGINDAPALAAADIGIAIGAGTDVARQTSDVILVRSNPLQVLDVIRLSKVSRRKIRQNVVWATAYNLLALPVAAGLFEGYGIVLTPAVGALLMALSTVIVALNARLITYSREG